MGDQNNNFNSTQPTETVMEIKPRRAWWKYAAGVAAVLVLIGGGYWAWDKYFSPAAQRARETQKNWEQAQKAMKTVEDLMRADTYGGKTPEETLSMFIDALKKGDVGLASKYFSLRGDGTPDPKWLEGLRETEKLGQLQKIIDVIPKMTYDKKSSYTGTAWFSVVNSEGIAEYSIILVVNKYSGVWKIESM